MRNMNKDLPYEQQMKILLGKYDKLMEENKMLREELSKRPGELKEAQHLAKKHKKKLDWVREELAKYLESLGIEFPYPPSVARVVKMVVKI